MRADGRYSHRVFAGVRHQHPGLATHWWGTLWGKMANAKGDDAACAKKRIVNCAGIDVAAQLAP
jgi:hypothetical protein